MNLETEIAKYEALPSELIGGTIKEVSYFEIDYGEPAFDLECHHSLDYGLQIETDDGVIFYMIWDWQHVRYDLKFKKGSLSDKMNSESKISCHNVSLSKYWKIEQGRKSKAENRTGAMPPPMEALLKRITFKTLNYVLKTDLR